MRRRSIPRIARDLVDRQAQEWALQVYHVLRPTQTLLDLFLLCLASGYLEEAALVHLLAVGYEDEALLVYGYLSQHVPRPLHIPLPDQSDTLHFAWWASPAAFAVTFRVASYEQLCRLSACLRMPVFVNGERRLGDGTTVHTYAASGLDALAVCLARLAFPGRLEPLLRQLHLSWSIGKLSSIITAAVRYLDRTFGNHVLFGDCFFNDTERLDRYAQALTDSGAPFRSCVGFIDGTTFHICRPSGEWVQAAFYSGHKRYHCMRWQGITMPDGMIASFYGPVPGASNDRGLLAESGVDQRLYALFGQRPGLLEVPTYFIYGDAGYAGGGCTTVYTAVDFPPECANAANAVRVSIENVFGASKGWCMPVLPVSPPPLLPPRSSSPPPIDFSSHAATSVGQWAFTKYAMGLALKMSPIAAEMKIGALLYNCINCMCPGTVSQRFGVGPPTLEWYLSRV